MDDSLRDLYQEVILDHGRNPRNFRTIEPSDRDAEGHNPLCGDTLHVYLSVDETGKVTDCAFQGRGCAISMASASLMTEIVTGRTEAEAQALFEAFQKMATGKGDMPDGADDDAWERLAVLSGVREFPMRVKCATLAWHTLNAAVEGQGEATTE